MADNLNDQLTYNSMDYAVTTVDETTWRPVRGVMPIGGIQIRNELYRLKKKVPISSASTTPGQNGTPETVLSVSATQSPTKGQGQTLSLVSVSFTRDPADKNFAGVRIWFTGFKGSTTPSLMASGTVSPISFVCDTTKETVTVAVQPYSNAGASPDLSTCLTTTVTLNGVVQAPPAPSIAQSLTSTPTGVQFSFNQEGGLLQDVVQAYRVYKNSTNNSGTATVFKNYPQDPKNTGQVVVQDVLSNGTISYYWVSAVNTSGLESSLTQVAGSGTVISGFANSSDNMVRNGDFSGGNANWSASTQVGWFKTGQSGVPVGTSYIEVPSSTGGAFFLLCDDLIPVDTNQQYLVSCWMRMPTGNNNQDCYAGLFEYDANKNGISHVFNGYFIAGMLYTAISRTTDTFGNANGWQYFEGIIGGPPLANTSSPTVYQWAQGTVYVRPIFLINDSNGTAQTVQITGVRLSKVEASAIDAYKKVNGVNLIANSEFRNGISGYSVYDNNATGNVTIAFDSALGAPNSTGNRMHIHTASGAAPSPGLGGFTVGMPPDSGTLTVGQYHRGDRILIRMYAYIPRGYTVHYASNAFGDQGSVVWLRSQSGQSSWYEYMLMVTIGSTGTFSTIGYFWISSTLPAPIDWWVGSFEMIDIEQVQLSGANYQLYRQGVSTNLITQGSIIPTQSFLISFSCTSSSISLSWAAQTLFRSDGSTFTVSSGSQTYSSLSNSTTYYIYPYINVLTSAIGFANGSPPGTSSSSTTATQAYFDNRSALSPLVLTTASSGGGGGSGGGSGGGGDTCPEENELVEVSRNGQILQIKVKELDPQTDLLKGWSFQDKKDVYRKVMSVHSSSCAAWYAVQGHRVSPCEPVFIDGQWMPAHKAPGARFDTFVGVKVEINVEVDDYDEHNYWLVGPGGPLLVHNFLPYC